MLFSHLSMKEETFFRGSLKTFSGFSLSNPTNLSLLHHVLEKINKILAQHLPTEKLGRRAKRRKRLNGVNLLKITKLH